MTINITKNKLRQTTHRQLTNMYVCWYIITIKHTSRLVGAQWPEQVFMRIHVYSVSHWITKSIRWSNQVRYHEGKCWERATTVQWNLPVMSNFISECSVRKSIVFVLSIKTYWYRRTFKTFRSVYIVCIYFWILW